MKIFRIFFKKEKDKEELEIEGMKAFLKRANEKLGEMVSTIIAIEKNMEAEGLLESNR